MRMILVVIVVVAFGACERSAAIDCHGHDEVSFPSVDTSCQTPTDCVLVTHQVDCCGNRPPMLIAQTSATSFAQAEATCEAQYGPCGCVSRVDAGFIHWEIGCASGHCTLTEIPPDAGSADGGAGVQW